MARLFVRAFMASVGPAQATRVNGQIIWFQTPVNSSSCVRMQIKPVGGTADPTIYAIAVSDTTFQYKMGLLQMAALSGQPVTLTLTGAAACSSTSGVSNVELGAQQREN